jgi:hypothetical protein
MRLEREYYSTKLNEYHRADAMHYAQYWHGGQFTELYKLSSSGEVDDIQDLLSEIVDCEKLLGKLPDEENEELDNYSQIDCLKGYAMALAKQEGLNNV